MGLDHDEPCEEENKDMQEQKSPSNLPAKTEPIELVFEEIYKHEFSLSEADRIRLRSISAEIKSGFRKLTKDKIAVGLKMVEAKSILPHGDFSDWCNNDLGIMSRSAQRYMAVVEKFGNHLDQVEHLQISLLETIVERKNWELVSEGVMSELANGKPLLAEDLRSRLPEKKAPQLRAKKVETFVVGTGRKAFVDEPSEDEVRVISRIATFLNQCDDNSLQILLSMDAFRIGEMLVGQLTEG